jgi:hypothetical protein
MVIVLNCVIEKLICTISVVDVCVCNESFDVIAVLKYTVSGGRG